jgi:hypothetical protein
VEEDVLPGDVDAGDVIILAGAGHEVLVKMVRLGQGGFILTVSPVGDDTPEAERLITLTATMHLRKRR